MGAINAGIARPTTSWRDTMMAYVSLTKPRIISLLLITTIPAMILAEQGVPSIWLMVATVVGGTLAAGGANAINCYIDRDIDEVMHRTQGRPLPLGLIEPAHALGFAIGLEALAFVLLATTSNLLAASLAMCATLFYVFVYTLWLKRRTSQNIVIGGAAGAVPPLVGWAAVTGDLAWAPVVLFAIIFFWTPPHFWALSIKYRDDYARAGVPMLPVVASQGETTRQMLLYALALVPVSFALLLTGTVGWVYGAVAGVLGAHFVWETWRLKGKTTRSGDAQPGAAMGVFRASITYLALIFVAVAADVLILG